MKNRTRVLENKFSVRRVKCCWQACGTHGAFLGKVESEFVQLLLPSDGLLDPLGAGHGQLSKMGRRLLDALGERGERRAQSQAHSHTHTSLCAYTDSLFSPPSTILHLSHPPLSSLLHRLTCILALTVSAW